MISLLENEAECVIDQINKIYGETIKGWTKDKLIKKIANLEKSYYSNPDIVFLSYLATSRRGKNKNNEYDYEILSY